VQLASLEQGHISDEKACHPASWAKEARACVDSQAALSAACWRHAVVINMRVNGVVVLMLLSWSAQAQPLPPDQACAAIVRTLDNATGHRDSNREAVR
jgi:hypothetical protein